MNPIFLYRKQPQSPDLTQPAGGNFFRHLLATIGMSAKNLPEIVFTMQSLPTYYTDKEANEIINDIMQTFLANEGMPFGEKHPPTEFLVRSDSISMRFGEFLPAQSDQEILLDILRASSVRMNAPPPAQVVIYAPVQNTH